MKRNPVKTLLFYIAYFAIACAVGGLVTAAAPAPFTSGLAFGAIMAAVMIACGHIERTIDARSANPGSLRKHFGMFMLLYVALPAAIAFGIHVFFPTIVVLGAAIEVFLALLWMPVFLASLLQFKSKIC